MLRVGFDRHVGILLGDDPVDIECYAKQQEREEQEKYVLHFKDITPRYLKFATISSTGLTNKPLRLAGADHRHRYGKFKAPRFAI